MLICNINTYTTMNGLNILKKISFMFFKILKRFVYFTSISLIKVYTRIKKVYMIQNKGLTFIKSTKDLYIYKYVCDKLKENIIVFKEDSHKEIFLLDTSCINASTVLYANIICKDVEIDITDYIRHFSFYHSTNFDSITWMEFIIYVKEHVYFDFGKETLICIYYEDGSDQCVEISDVIFKSISIPLKI